MRAYSATVGDTDGNIIAAIITIHTPRNQPTAPRSVPGPSSIPRMRSVVDHHASAARPNSAAIRPRRARAAANAGPRPVPPSSRAGREATALTSGRPREGRVREAGLALVLDAEGTDARARRLGDRQLGAGRMEDAGQTRRLARLDAERDNVLDLEVDRVADPDAVPEAVLADLDRRALDAEVLAHERREARHRPAELTAEHRA